MTIFCGRKATKLERRFNHASRQVGLTAAGPGVQSGMLINGGVYIPNLTRQSLVFALAYSDVEIAAHLYAPEQRLLKEKPRFQIIVPPLAVRVHLSG